MASKLCALVALAFVGCGHRAAVAVAPADLALFAIPSGSYAVSGLASDGDGCGLALDRAGFTTLALRNDGDGDLELGVVRGESGAPPHFEPSAYTAGAGHFSDGIHGMTTTQTHVIADAATPPCSYDLSLTNVVTVTGQGQLAVALTSSASAIADCTTPPPPSCTSRWRYQLTFVPSDLSAP